MRALAGGWADDGPLIVTIPQKLNHNNKKKVVKVGLPLTNLLDPRRGDVFLYDRTVNLFINKYLFMLRFATTDL